MMKMEEGLEIRGFRRSMELDRRQERDRDTSSGIFGTVTASRFNLG